MVSESADNFREEGQDIVGILQSPPIRRKRQRLRNQNVSHMMLVIYQNVPLEGLNDFGNSVVPKPVEITLNLASLLVAWSIIMKQLSIA